MTALPDVHVHNLRQSHCHWPCPRSSCIVPRVRRAGLFNDGWPIFCLGDKPLPLVHNLLRVLVKETAKRSIPGSEVLPMPLSSNLSPSLTFLFSTLLLHWVVGIPEPVRIFWMVHVLSYFWQRCRPARWLVLPIFYLLTN